MPSGLYSKGRKNLLKHIHHPINITLTDHERRQEPDHFRSGDANQNTSISKGANKIARCNLVHHSPGDQTLTSHLDNLTGGVILQAIQPGVEVISRRLDLSQE